MSTPTPSPEPETPGATETPEPEVSDTVEPQAAEPRPRVEDLEDLDPEQAAQIEASATEARVRRAPRFGVFLSVGIVLGAVVGFVASKIVGAVRDDVANTGVTAALSALGLAVVGGLVAGLLAVRADRRS